MGKCENVSTGDEMESLCGAASASDATNATGDDSLLQRMPILECPVAGIGFYDIFDIWDELYVGAKIALVHDRDNPHDENAVAVALEGDYDGNPDDFDFDYILGYIPRRYNQDIATMLDNGCESQIEAEISEMRTSGPLNNRLHITVYFQGRDPLPPQVDRLYILDMDDDKWNLLQEELLQKGYTYQRWGKYLPDVKGLPQPGDRVVFVHQHTDCSSLYLMMTVAEGDDSCRYLTHNEETDCCDNCSPYVLTVVRGDVTLPNNQLTFLGDGWKGYRRPEYQLEKKTSDALLELLVSQTAVAP